MLRDLHLPAALRPHHRARALKRKYPIKWIADFRDPLRNPFRPASQAAQRADRYYEERPSFAWPI